VSASATAARMLMSSVVSAAGRLVAVLPGGAWPALEALVPAGVRC
jgi:hypothetical protein